MEYPRNLEKCRQRVDSESTITPPLCAEASSRLSVARDGKIFRHQKRNLTQTAHATQPDTASVSESCAGQLLTEIEELIAELRVALARLAVFWSLHSPNGTHPHEDEDAIEWMSQALEDINATVLGTEAARHEEVLSEPATKEQDLIGEMKSAVTEKQPESGTAR